MRLKKKLLAYLLTFLVLMTGITIQQPSQIYAEQVGDMAVHFLDVGQGLAILVQSGGQNLLYDGGGRNSSSYVVSYLQNQQIESIDYLISSHYDQDHVSGLVGCLNAFDVDMVIGPDYVHSSDLYSSFMNTVTAEGLEVYHPYVGETFDFGTGSFTVIAPSRQSNDSNDNSVAIKLENGDNSFIFTGDAEHSSEADMINTGIDLSCDVLCVGHHGSATSTSWDFLENTVPEYAVISCGVDNSYGHPDADTMEKLDSMGIDVFRTDKQGTIICVSNGETITWTLSPCNDYSSGSGNEIVMVDETPQTKYTYEPDPEPVQTYQEPSYSQPVETMVWLSATGSKYHNKPNCGNMNPANARQVTQSQAISSGYDACKKCY